jgi:hypothetical protein
MSVSAVCHNFCDNALSEFNQARMASLNDCVMGLISGDQLTLTAIGRHLPGPVDVRHKIKRVDRFLGNDHLQKEVNLIYGALAQRLTKALPFLVIGVDWSGCCSRHYHLLRASLLYDGRAIPLLTQVVAEKDQESEKVHDEFLEQMKSIFGTQKMIYVVTDGGFKTPWLEKVRSLGWHFISRVRGRIYGKVDDKTWLTVAELGQSATRKPKALGTGKLGKTAKTSSTGEFHVYKEKAKGRHHKRGKKQANYPDNEQRHKEAANEPWLLFTSDKYLNSNQVVKLYSMRMQVEQNFRDDKSQRYGFGWQNSFTTGVKRISVLCLIASVATIILWLLGYALEQKGWHLKFQANSTKNRRVLSFLSLAKNAIVQMIPIIDEKLLREGLTILASNYADRFALTFGVK